MTLKSKLAGLDSPIESVESVNFFQLGLKTLSSLNPKTSMLRRNSLRRFKSPDL